ncbi:hypothetical protein CPC735_000110 [Coccidioides posadasii C735 delta SOWgp]|uniref:Peroxin 22-like protein n=1 Tax=Coccidioides posadasii (strain C735) TaxID=222929 RepID=C5NZX8_COCP7|nr:hypothetical protein CPC735_000110 [Coccidioides posadasii C735 delta SOWgp]EER29755.1 hypothetical protein CPC735_000110 [Coccidioides posadasii C735 delta SOWgp]|eukprot:XP_003071900.1 hypothetical protein CPC735_000110 [Coccidioides posadasii C735 delta SOWgp]
MSDRYFGDNRRRGPAGFSSGGRRTALGYWVPLAVTVTVAAVGLVAWVWSERNDGDEDGHNDGQEGRAPIGLDPGADDPGYAQGTTTGTQHRSPGEEDSVISRMQGAWRRTPSPQQLFDGASKTVAAGVAAAGAAVGGALSAIREEGTNDFEDHSRWAEETTAPGSTGPPTRSAPGVLPRGASLAADPTAKKRKTVAIVVSSVCSGESDEESASEHASILARLPEYIEPEAARIFVLIYAPGMKPRSANEGNSSRQALSMASSYSNISPEEAAGAESRGDLKDVEPRPASDDFPSASHFFKTLYNQAQVLVDQESMIMPFSTPTGHVNILRNLSPDLVYMQESITGDKGENVHNLTRWIRQTVVVVGDEGGRGGLVDSDDESAVATEGERWWQKEGVIGLGKRIDVVDGVRAGDDWKRRVCGHE